MRTPVHFIDVMATLVDVGRASYPSEFGGEKIVPMRGVSIAPLFAGEDIARLEPLFWQWGGGKALRDGRWKLVVQGRNKPWELYDMALDRTEITNLASTHPDRVAALAARWDSWFAATPAKERRKNSKRKKK